MMISRRNILSVFIAALFCLAILPSGAGAQQSSGIAAVVNDEAISLNQLNARMSLIIGSAGIEDSAEVRQKMAPQVITGLVDEAVRLQEAKRLELEIAPAEIEAGLANLAAQNGLQPDQLKQMLSTRRIKISTLENQIRAQIAWRKVVGRKVRSQINVTERDVSAELERQKNAIGKTQFLVSEIFLPVEKPKEDKRVREMALDMSAGLNREPDKFPRIARQFSRAAGAAQGGDIGWIQQGQLQDAMNKALMALPKGGVSQPVRSLTGYHIFMMRNKKEFTESDIPSEDQLLEQLGLKRLERQQYQYFLDLKSSAFIDIRI